jgi:hypothetical protein
MRTSKLLVILGLVFLVEHAWAGDVTVQFRLPAVRGMVDSCATPDTIPGYPLLAVKARLWRFNGRPGAVPDTLPPFYLDAKGLEDSLFSITFAIEDSVWGGGIEVWPLDVDSTESCTYGSKLWTQEWKPIKLPPGLFAQAWDNMDMTGESVSQVDSLIDWSCGEWPLSVAEIPSGLIGPGWFSVRWTGYLTVPVLGYYSICLDSDDGGRVWVNDMLVVENWGGSGRVKVCGSTGLPAGRVPIRVEYVQNGGSCAARLLWTAPGGREEVIPAWVLSH